jgi:hypothetical protein
MNRRAFFARLAVATGLIAGGVAIWRPRPTRGLAPPRWADAQRRFFEAPHPRQIDVYPRLFVHANGETELLHAAAMLGTAAAARIDAEILGAMGA